jgi:hypothetical protein
MHAIMHKTRGTPILLLEQWKREEIKHTLVTELKGTCRLELAAGSSTGDGVSTNLCDESRVIASKEAHHGLMLWESKSEWNAGPVPKRTILTQVGDDLQ